MIDAPRRDQSLLKWFGQSKATGPDGMPAVLYRGEHGETTDGEYLQTRLNSLSFTADWGAANTYSLSPNNSQLDLVADAPRVIPVYLKIESPIIENYSDPFVDLSDLMDKLGHGEARRIALKFDRDIRYTGNWMENYSRDYDNVAELLKEAPNELGKLYFFAYKFLDDNAEVKHLKRAGYDGAIHIGSGETATVLEYRVFGWHQVRSALSGRSMLIRRGRGCNVTQPSDATRARKSASGKKHASYFPKMR